MIEKIQGQANPFALLQNKTGDAQKTDADFADTLKEAIQGVNALQKESAETTEMFINGEISDMHQVTLSMEKARVGLELLLEIRNKMLEGYQEIMRMQL
jgi:flagellar hook-basal body complex protein FliE